MPIVHSLHQTFDASQKLGVGHEWFGGSQKLGVGHKRLGGESESVYEIYPNSPNLQEFFFDQFFAACAIW